MLKFFKSRKIDQKKLLAESLAGMKLPHFSRATIRSLQLLRNPGSTSEKIARSIEANPGLVVHVLRTVNAAAYGLRSKVDCVSHAINLLGRAKVESLVVAMAVKGGLQKTAPHRMNQRFWYAAATRASLARGLAALIDPKTQSESFVGGLLQDMALPLLEATRPYEYAPLIRQSREDEIALEELERSAFGWDHSEIGACVAAHWRLPDLLTNSIGEHHVGGHHVPPAIHLVSHVRERPRSFEIETLVEQARDRYGVPPDRVIEVVKESRIHAKELAALMK